MIPNPNPITVPSVESKTYDQQWVYTLNVMAPSVGNGRIAIELLPFNSTTGELGGGDLVQTTSTDKLFDAIEAVPELKTAFDAVLAAVGPTSEWIAAQEAAAAEEVTSPEEEEEVTSPE